MSGGNCLLIIDPQNDFCEPDGNLFVKGAVQDMKRLAEFIDSNHETISNILVSLDLHKYYHIAHPLFWQNPQGKNPKIFSEITAKDMESGIWMTSNPNHKALAYDYLVALETNSRYRLTIWPPHCITGTKGSDICEPIVHALKSFEIEKLGGVDYILKSSNSFTEHYSAYKAEVQIHSDKDTLPNKKLLLKIADADKVLVAGEASSHCVANTILDFSVALNGDLSKFIFLSDCSSPVKDFEYLSDIFFGKAAEMGMQFCPNRNLKGMI